MTTGRHEARMWAVQLLYQHEFNDEPMPEALARFWESRKAGPSLRGFTEALVNGVLHQRDALDQDLQRYTEHWDLKRLNAVDRNILRVALFEILHRHDIPPVVSINEAIELAKSFNGNESGRFVNGVLDRIHRDQGRPSRTTLTAVAGRTERTSETKDHEDGPA